MRKILTVFVVAAIVGCRSPVPPSAKVVTCRPRFVENAITIVRGGLPPPGEAPVKTVSLVLGLPDGDIHILFASQRLQALLDTNHVYTFMIDPGGTSNQWTSIPPHVVQVDDGDKTIYRFKDEMKKF